MNHFDDIYSNLKNNEIDYGTVLIDNEEVVIAPTNYRKLMKNEDEKIRKEVYEKFNSATIKHSGTFASLLNSYVSMEDKIAEIYLLIAKKEQLVAEIEAYKKSLIYNCVTGKKL